MIVDADSCLVRPYRESDLEALARQGDDKSIASHLRDGFPNPYTLSDARSWLDFVATQDPASNFAIEVDGAFAGGIGFTEKCNVHRFTAEVGYWLGREYWGRGIATDALRAFAPWLFATKGLLRLEALVFDGNPASRRVLEKAGFAVEARMRQAVVKNGNAIDAWLYARLRSDADPRTSDRRAPPGMS